MLSIVKNVEHGGKVENRGKKLSMVKKVEHGEKS